MWFVLHALQMAGAAISADDIIRLPEPVKADLVVVNSAGQYDY
jgi:hypothetical protein